MIGQYEKDKVAKTYELYASQIAKAIEQLRKRDSNFDIYRNIKFPKGRKISGSNIGDLEKLEKMVKTLTKDPNVRLLEKKQRDILDILIEDDWY